MGLVAISVNMNNSNINLTGYAVGDGCANSGEEGCDGTSVILCINGQWQNVGQIPGQCEYEPENNNPPNADNPNDGGPDGTNWLLIIAIIILVIAIIAIAIFIFYRMKKKSGNKSIINTKPPLNPTRFPGAVRNTFSGPINSNPIISAGVKRYIPPKR